MRSCMSIKLICSRRWAIKMTALPVLTFASALAWAKAELSASDVPLLEAEALLTHVLQVSRSHLHAWPARELTPAQQLQFIEYINRAEQGEPIAYITGHREFWSLDLLVTPDTLIPRPETELLVEQVLATLNDNHPKLVADLGTGSGAIALALATERPHWVVHATDRMSAALKVAASNAARLQVANVIFHEGDWCAALPDIPFDAIISNPPYIAENDERIMPTVRGNEPHSALFSGNDGFEAIQQIILQAKNYLKSGGYLFLEHGSLQAARVRYLFEKAGYTKVDLHRDLAGLERVTLGCKL
jgi:release factor glutamine methyltransferase